jgi:hypothetical protein
MTGNYGLLPLPSTVREYCIACSVARENKKLKNNFF